MNLNTQFKRLAIGQTFTTAQGSFRKAGKHGAFRIRDDGRGQTHAKIPFARSTSVLAGIEAPLLKLSEALTLFLGIGKIESRTRHYMINMPAFMGIILPAHTRLPKGFEMLFQCLWRTPDQNERSGRFNFTSENLVDSRSRVTRHSIPRISMVSLAHPPSTFRGITLSVFFGSLGVASYPCSLSFNRLGFVT